MTTGEKAARKSGSDAQGGHNAREGSQGDDAEGWWPERATEKAAQQRKSRAEQRSCELRGCKRGQERPALGGGRTRLKGRGSEGGWDCRQAGRSAPTYASENGTTVQGVRKGQSKGETKATSSKQWRETRVAGVKENMSPSN